MVIRPPTPADREAIAEVLLQAALDAWGAFLGEERITAANRDRTHPVDLVAADEARYVKRLSS